jgi:hypothetical protein
MLCEACEASSRSTDEPKEPLPSKEPVQDQLCSRCGQLLGTDAVDQRVKRKQSQLARFGLAETRHPLLNRRGDR